MPDVVNQTMGNGNQFNIDQVNNLVDNDTLGSPNVTFNGGGGGGGLWCDPSAGFSMEAKIHGGHSSIDGNATMGDTAGAGAGIASHADSALTQEAFNQTITQGANIQFNSITMQVAGTDLHDDHSVLN